MLHEPRVSSAHNLERLKTKREAAGLGEAWMHLFRVRKRAHARTRTFAYVCPHWGE